jgi:ribose-phosphate pyrophosphokinase
MIVKRFNQVFHVTQYPAGEQHVELVDDSPFDYIIADCRNFNDLMNCLVANGILTRLGYVDLNPQWVIPYMPFARHDRRNHIFDGLELPIAVEIARGLRASIIDPHSDVAGQVPHYTQAQVVEQAVVGHGLFDNGALVAIPDAGAVKKVDSWFRRIHALVPHELQAIQCLKKRDTITGKLSGFQVLADDLSDKAVTIVDDICDGGATFIGLAEALMEKGVGELRLLVTHGLFTKGVGTLLNYFDTIYTLDIYDPGKHPRLVELIDTERLIKENLPE